MSERMDEFRDIPGWPGYRVSRSGIILSCRTNGGNCSDSWRLRKPQRSRDGYYLIMLHHKGETIFTSVHSLVLMAFVGPRPNGYVACHNNSVRTDNRVSNLRWDTQQGNIDDKSILGTTAKGERNGRAKLTADGVLKIIHLRSSLQLSFGAIARQVGISKRQVMRIIKGEQWKHVTKIKTHGQKAKT